MKRSDLHREWARVLDMCEGTGVKPEDCWKYDGESLGDHPELDSDPDEYEFAVAILEGKPVFVGDELYWKCDATKFDWAGGFITEWDERLSWAKPKRTFLLNDVDLPCPVQSPGDWGLLIGATLHYFDSEDDYKKVRHAMNKVLQDATSI